MRIAADNGWLLAARSGIDRVVIPGHLDDPITSEINGADCIGADCIGADLIATVEVGNATEASGFEGARRKMPSLS